MNSRSSESLKADTTTLQVSEDACHVPLMVHREVLLGDLPTSDRGEFVLVKDDDDRLMGIVPVREIDKRLLSANQFERTRWSDMPIGALSNLSFADTDTTCPAVQQSELKCSAIHEDGGLLGLALNGDLFLSWRRLESLFTAALSDPLTGLMNRLAYERRIREEWNRSVRTATSIAVVVVDLDKFKSVNDTYGHAVGDEVLSTVARHLEMAMRSYDVVARFGGDEFVALCLGCAPGEIEIPVGRLLHSIDRIRLKVGAETLKVRASVGAAVQHSDFDSSPAEDLFVAADNCLYEAKKSDNRAWSIEFGFNENSGARPVDYSKPAADAEHHRSESVS